MVEPVAVPAPATHCPACFRSVTRGTAHCANAGCSWFTCPRCAVVFERVTRLVIRGPGWYSGPGGSPR